MTTKRTRALVITAAAAAVLVAFPSAPAMSQSPAPATLEVWLAGILSTATPGTTYRQWTDDQINRFKETFPGSDVNITLLPQNNDESAAQLSAAFASGDVPDVLMQYSGTMITAYESELLRLNDYINATPGFWDSMTNWDASCLNYDCRDGQGEVVAVPNDAYIFVNWYNKDLFEKAGIASPPTTWDEVYDACAKLKATGVYGYIWGDRDGYATVTTMDEDLASYLEPDEWKGGVDNTLKFTDPRFLQSLNAISKLRELDCVQPDYATREQLDSANDFLNEKGAMFVGQPQFLPYWTSIYDKLGVAPVPQSGNGPNKGKTAAASGQGWSIPKAAAHPDLAWELIKILSDEEAGLSMPSQLGSPPANKVAQAKVEDPLVREISLLAQEGVMPMYDNVVPQATALYWYKCLNQAFAGAISGEQCLADTQSQFDIDVPPPS